VVDSPARHPWFEPRWKQMAIIAALVAFAFGAVALSRSGSGSATPGPRPASVTPLPSPAGGIRILAGSPKPYIDRAGRRWRADEYFTGGVAQPGPVDFFGRPPDPSLYRLMRYGDFSYAIPAPPGVYELWLHFAEPTFRSGTEGSEGGENERHFTVTVNGATLLHDFDVVTDSGTFPVDVRAFRDITPAADGFVHLRFQAVMGPPILNAIELVPGTPGHILPIRIRAGDSSFTDQAGNIWNPDDYYIGGRLATHKGDVAGTPDPDLYAGERYGNFSYAIPVPPGRYSVTLYFAETFWDPESKSSNKGGVGSRVFSVSCNGAMLMSDFDILKETKPFQALSHTFHNLRPNGQGKLLLAFSPITNYASVKAIEVKDE
jgi:Malectin domain